MQNWIQYYDKTKKEYPRNNVKFLIDSLNLKPTNAIDLGCGQGNDAVYLINNDFKVLGIDKENVEDIIRARLPEKKQESIIIPLKYTLNKNNFML